MNASIPAELKNNAALLIPMSDLNLSVRARKALCLLGCLNTVGQIICLRETQLREIKNCGAVTINEIKSRLENLGLRLGMLSDADVEDLNAQLATTDKSGSDPLERTLRQFFDIEPDRVFRSTDEQALKLFPYNGFKLHLGLSPVFAAAANIPSIRQSLNGELEASIDRVAKDGGRQIKNLSTFHEIADGEASVDFDFVLVDFKNGDIAAADRDAFVQHVRAEFSQRVKPLIASHLRTALAEIPEPNTLS